MAGKDALFDGSSPRTGLATAFGGHLCSGSEHAAEFRVHGLWVVEVAKGREESRSSVLVETPEEAECTHLLGEQSSVVESNVSASKLLSATRYNPARTKGIDT